VPGPMPPVRPSELAGGRGAEGRAREGEARNVLVFPLLARPFALGALLDSMNGLLAFTRRHAGGFASHCSFLEQGSIRRAPARVRVLVMDKCTRGRRSRGGAMNDPARREPTPSTTWAWFVVIKPKLVLYLAMSSSSMSSCRVASPCRRVTPLAFAWCPSGHRPRAAGHPLIERKQRGLGRERRWESPRQRLRTLSAGQSGDDGSIVPALEVMRASWKRLRNATYERALLRPFASLPAT